jgi:hypothetical protein
MLKLTKKTITTTTEKYNDRGFLIEKKTQVVEKEYEREVQQVVTQREPMFRGPYFGDELGIFNYKLFDDIVSRFQVTKDKVLIGDSTV